MSLWVLSPTDYCHIRRFKAPNETLILTCNEVFVWSGAIHYVLYLVCPNNYKYILVTGDLRYWGIRKPNVWFLSRAWQSRDDLMESCTWLSSLTTPVGGPPACEGSAVERVGSAGVSCVWESQLWGGPARHHIVTWQYHVITWWTAGGARPLRWRSVLVIRAALLGCLQCGQLFTCPSLDCCFVAIFWCRNDYDWADIKMEGRLHMGSARGTLWIRDCQFFQHMHLAMWS